MYRKGQRGFLNGITNVSVERNFYGEPSESDLDERITNLESVFAPLVARLRSGDCGAVSDAEITEQESEELISNGCLGMARDIVEADL